MYPHPDPCTCRTCRGLEFFYTVLFWGSILVCLTLYSTSS